VPVRRGEVAARTGNAFLWKLRCPSRGGGGISGGLMPARGLPTYACFGVEVDDVDTTYEQALGLGATSLAGPTDNPGGSDRPAFAISTEASFRSTASTS
jgi:predicted enzyme related to lactoylglutathione lyase